MVNDLQQTARPNSDRRGLAAPARLTDVAAVAEVSLTTASHCFSGKRHVAQATKELVWRTAAELGFKSELGTRTVAVLVRPPESVQAAGFGTTSFSNLAGAMALSAMSRGFNVITASHIDEGNQDTPINPGQSADHFVDMTGGNYIEATRHRGERHRAGQI